MKFGYVFAKRLGTTLKKFLYNRSKRFANMTQTFFHKRGSQKLEENLKKFKWFYSWVHLYGYCVHSPYPFFLSSFLPVSAFFNFFPARGPPPLPPWECDRSHSLLRCIAFAWGHRKTAENLCRYSRPFHSVCPQSTISEKMACSSAFRNAGRRPGVTHPSTDLAPGCLTWVTAWCRTPTTHQTLSVTSGKY